MNMYVYHLNRSHKHNCKYKKKNQNMMTANLNIKATCVYSKIGL